MLRTPLAQFLAIGLSLYLGAAWIGGLSTRPADVDSSRERDNARADDLADDGAGRANDGRGFEANTTASREIVVERENLLDFVQRRTQQPDAGMTRAAFEALSPAARQDWIDRFVREEALVREARRLGLDRDDELIRRHLVQKMEFLTSGLAEGEARPSMETLSAYYRAQAEDYRIPGSLSFAHVFVRFGEGESESRSVKGSMHARAESSSSRARAVELLAKLERERATARDALEFGDRFLYNRHYVDRTLDEVRSHFGDGMAQALAAASPNASRWQGPIASVHGWHLVLLSAHQPDRLPPLEEVVTHVRDDLSRARSEAALEDGLRSVISRYRVELDPSLAGIPSPETTATD